MRAVTFGAMSVAALLVSSAARAQTPEVERLLRHGIELRQQGSNEAALGEFRRAHHLANTPRTLAQVALAEQALGRWVEAETHLREALRGANDPWVTRNRGALDGAMGVIAQHVGLVMVTCDVDGAELWIGERRAGALPLTAPLRVDAGEVAVSVRWGGRRASQRVQVNAGETAAVRLRVGQVESRQAVAVSVGAEGATSPRLDNGASTSSPGSTQRALGWVSLVGGVIGLGVGVGGVLYRDDGARAYNDNFVLGYSRCPGARIAYEQQPFDCQTWLDQEYTGNIMQWAGLAGGGALSLLGIILVATAPSGTPRASALMQCGVGPGDVGAACGGRF